MIADAVTGIVAAHGEGPVWFAADGLVRWVDMLRGDVLETNLDSGATMRRHVGDLVAMVRPRRSGGMIVALERGFATLDADGSINDLGALWPAEAGVRMNDGGCDPSGRCYAGSMVTSGDARSGELWRLDPDGTARRVLGGLQVANGLAWGDDGATAYFVDSADARVDLLEFDTNGDLDGRRPLISVPAGDGVPDGLCLDAEGGVWVALWDGGAVHRYDIATGSLTERIEVPVARPTACAFAGDDLRTLVISTSQTSDDDSAAGRLYAVRPGVAGAAPYAFAG